MKARLHSLHLCALLIATLSCGAPSFFATATPEPTSTPQPSPSDYARWPVVLRDFFNEPANDWELAEDSDDRFAKGTIEVSGGKYRWEVTANEGFIWWSLALENTSTSDFYAAVAGRQVSGAQDADYALIFRHDGDNYYTFQVSDTGQYTAYEYYLEEWTALIEWTAAEAIDPDGINRLAVAAEGARFRFFINDALVAEVEDDTIESGSAGVAVQVYNPGESAVFEFDNFEWRAPKTAVTVVTPTPEE
jgi:hypothetical protein